MHVTMTTANCPVRERHDLFHLYGVWLEHKAGPPKVILWPPSFNLPKQICRHQCSSPMFPYKSNLDRPEFYFVTVLYSLSVDFKIVLRMHFTFCNFLLPSPSRSIESDEKKRWLCIRRSSIVVQGEKNGLRSFSPRHSAMKIPHVSLLLLLQPNISKWNVELEQKLCSPFCTEIRTCLDRTLAALPHQYIDRFPELHCTVLRALDIWRWDACMLTVEWALCARKWWYTDRIDRKNVLACSERACHWFLSEIWNF